MLPFPGNDHAIEFDAHSAAIYARYGAMLAAVAPKVWALLPHILSLVNLTNTTAAMVNAFIVPLDDVEVALLLPIVLGEQANGALIE